MRIFWTNGSLSFYGETQEETDTLLAFFDMLKSDTLKVGEAAREAFHEERLATFPKDVQDRVKKFT